MDKNPDLSVIIASYNSGNLLKECLDSLQNQRTEKTFEIVVVDSSPNGLTVGIGEKFPEVKWYQFPERKFCGDARNFGFSVARGEIIAFIDADCRADQNWADQILETHRSPYLAIGGAIANGNPQSITGWAAYFCEFSQWMPNTPSKPLRDIAGANMSYKRKAFEIFGPLIEGTYSSDTEFHWRLVRNGHYLQFVPSIIVFHHNIDRFWNFLRHEFDHGKFFSKVRVLEQKFSIWRRTVFILISPLLPILLFYRTVRRVFKNRIYLKQFLCSFPLVFLGLSAWSFGEFLGYNSKSKK